jgi:hypothetical protein
MGGRSLGTRLEVAWRNASVNEDGVVAVLCDYSPAVRWLVCLSPILLLGCRKDPPDAHPAEIAQPDAAPQVSAGPVPPASVRRPRALGQPSPVGGRWLSCYGSFAPRGDPRLDVERLGQACGPPNGMVKIASFTGELAPDAGPPREHRHSAREGECFRVFAVADPKILDLDVEIFDPSRKRVAFDDGDDRWPIVKPDGPFCVYEAGEYSIRVQAPHGGGRYVLDLWKLAR